MLDPNSLTEREQALLAWKDTPEEWEEEWGGQYGVELVDLERKLSKPGTVPSNELQR